MFSQLSLAGMARTLRTVEPLAFSDVAAECFVSCRFSRRAVPSCHVRPREVGRGDPLAFPGRQTTEAVSATTTVERTAGCLSAGKEAPASMLLLGRSVGSWRNPVLKSNSNDMVSRGLTKIDLSGATETHSS